MDVDQATLLWVFRGVYVALSLLLAIFVWQFMRRERFVRSKIAPVYTPPENIELPEKLVALTVMAKPGRYFDSFKLYQLLHELGFVYGDNGIFEYLLPDKKTIAFSIINIRRPGTFEADPAQLRQTNGVLAAMQLPLQDGHNQTQYFHLLLSVLEELRVGLDALLCDSVRKPIKNDKLYELQGEIERFEQQYCTLIQNEYRQRVL